MVTRPGRISTRQPRISRPVWCSGPQREPLRVPETLVVGGRYLGIATNSGTRSDGSGTRSHCQSAGDIARRLTTNSRRAIPTTNSGTRSDER